MKNPGVTLTLPRLPGYISNPGQPDDLPEFVELDTFDQRVNLQGTKCPQCVERAKNYFFKRVWTLKPNYCGGNYHRDCDMCDNNRVVPIPIPELDGVLKNA